MQSANRFYSTSPSLPWSAEVRIGDDPFFGRIMVGLIRACSISSLVYSDGSTGSLNYLPPPFLHFPLFSTRIKQVAARARYAIRIHSPLPLAHSHFESWPSSISFHLEVMGGDGNKPSGNLLSTVKMEIFTKFISSS